MFIEMKDYDGKKIRIGNKWFLAENDFLDCTYEQFVRLDTLLVEDNSGACEAQPTTTGLTWSCSSDQRLKTDIQIPAAVLNYVRNIPLKDYTVIKTAERVMGPIAQELLETYPELVTTGEDGYYRVSSLGSWTLVKAIQEQQVIIESQKTEIETLKTQYNDLLQRIINLENK